MKNDFLYSEISNKIAKLIRNGVLKPGDRLPSVRMLCQEHSISMNTAKRVFLELEGQSLIESKVSIRSGASMLFRKGLIVLLSEKQQA